MAKGSHSDSLDSQQIEKLRSILTQRNGLFSTHLRLLKAKPFDIKLVDDPNLKRQWARHFPPKVAAEISNQIDQLKKEGLIEDS